MRVLGIGTRGDIFDRDFESLLAREEVMMIVQMETAV